MPLKSLAEYEVLAAQAHGHLCAGQILGLRMALHGVNLLGLEDPAGKDRKRLDLQEMAERCTLQFLNEAMLCLGEGILRSPRDGDIGAIFGLGFPPFLGGPFRYVDAQGPGRVLDRLKHWEQKLGARFAPAPLLVEKVKAGKGFY